MMKVQMLFKFVVIFSSVIVLNDAVYDSSWSSDRSCSSASLKNGRLRWRQRHRLARFMCFYGYVLVGSRYASCVNGEWDSPLPVCVRPGCAIPKIEHSLIMQRHQYAWMTIFCLPGYEAKGRSVMYCDGKRWNGTAPTCEDSSTDTTQQLSCDFEEPDLCGWQNDELHDFDWKRINTKTPSSFLKTGPPSDHTYLNRNVSGYYMYIESTSRVENDTARLISPVYRQTLTKDGCFTFYYHMYGRSIGGLRVYQKPDSVPIEALSKMTEVERLPILLFELWGNQGDTWYRNVAMLRNQSEDFQIVIEGLRGWSYTSDIAIDDVAILQGENCTIAKQQATTPADIVNSETCLNRCNLMGEMENTGNCDCTLQCIDNQKCCGDFFEVCVFNGDNTTTDDDKASSGDIPQTEKLVAQNVTSITTDDSTTFVPTTVKTIKTTIKTTTPVVITTTKATKPTTTPKIITTKATTTKKVTTTQTARKPVINNVTTTKANKITTRKITLKPTTIQMRKTTVPAPISTKSDSDKVVGKTVDLPRTKSPTKSGWGTTLIIILVVASLLGVVWTAHAARGARGRMLIARLRGRAISDPEVRYLHSDVDE